MDLLILELVLKCVLDCGIKVVIYEVDNQKNILVDIEVFDNIVYGVCLNDCLVVCMGEIGKWLLLVGLLGSQLQVQWVDGGVFNVVKKYFKMILVDVKNELVNDVEKVYVKVKEILCKYFDIKGFQGLLLFDVLGIGCVVEEVGLQGKVCVYGIGLLSEVVKFLELGVVGGIVFWDLKDVGLVMNKVVMMLVQGKKIIDGMDLGIFGYNKVSVKKGLGVGVIVIGQVWVEVDKKNYKQYVF